LAPRTGVGGDCAVGAQPAAFHFRLTQLLVTRCQWRQGLGAGVLRGPGQIGLGATAGFVTHSQRPALRIAAASGITHGMAKRFPGVRRRHRGTGRRGVGVGSPPLGGWRRGHLRRVRRRRTHDAGHGQHRTGQPSSPRREWVETIIPCMPSFHLQPLGLTVRLETVSGCQKVSEHASTRLIMSGRLPWETRGQTVPRQDRVGACALPFLPLFNTHSLCHPAAARDQDPAPLLGGARFWCHMPDMMLADHRPPPCPRTRSPPPVIG